MAAKPIWKWKFFPTEPNGLPSKSSNDTLGNATNTSWVSDTNGDVNKGRMGNTIKPGEHVENVIIWENMNRSKEGIK